MRFLELYWMNVVGDLDYLFPNLRWLSWHKCPPDFKATNLNLENLVILDLSWSDISEKWDGWSKIKVYRDICAVTIVLTIFLTYVQL